jgi:hypothetical protein
MYLENSPEKFLLIGIDSSGHITIITHWDKLPAQETVDSYVNGAKARYVTMMLMQDILMIPGEWVYNPYSHHTAAYY